MKGRIEIDQNDMVALRALASAPHDKVGLGSVIAATTQSLASTQGAGSIFHAWERQAGSLPWPEPEGVPSFPPALQPWVVPTFWLFVVWTITLPVSDRFLAQGNPDQQNVFLGNLTDLDVLLNMIQFLLKLKGFVFAQIFGQQ